MNKQNEAYKKIKLLAKKLGYSDIKIVNDNNHSYEKLAFIAKDNTFCYVMLTTMHKASDLIVCSTWKMTYRLMEFIVSYYNGYELLVGDNFSIVLKKNETIDEALVRLDFEGIEEAHDKWKIERR